MHRKCTQDSYFLYTYFNVKEDLFMSTHVLLNRDILRKSKDFASYVTIVHRIDISYRYNLSLLNIMNIMLINIMNNSIIVTEII